jgi:hypothetical protein
VATGALPVLFGAVVDCSFWAVLPVVVPDVLALAAVIAPGRDAPVLTATPRAPAAPAPRVIAVTQASPLCRASCRAAEAGGLVVVLPSPIGGRGKLCGSLSMRPRSNTHLCGLWVLPLNRF